MVALICQSFTSYSLDADVIGIGAYNVYEHVCSPRSINYIFTPEVMY